MRNKKHVRGFVPQIKDRAPLINAMLNIETRIVSLQGLLTECRKVNPKNYWNKCDLTYIDHAIRTYTDAKERRKRGWYDPN